MNKFKTMEDKLGLDKFKPSHETHLKIRKEINGKKVNEKDLVENILFICPAKVYTYDENKGQAIVSFENCLECGTCRVAAPDEVDWQYPTGGFGVTFKYG